MKSRLLLIAVALVTVLVTGSCHSSRSTARGSDTRTTVTGKGGKGIPPADRKTADALIRYARKWIGTPYRYGGNDRNGIDCSGLTCNVFEHVAGIRLPRDSRSQSRYCAPVDRRDISPGDLVFFSGKKGGSGRINHVGIYIGDGRMIHASSSRGVTESSITDGYWRDRYTCAGRVTASAAAAPSSGTSSASAPAATPPQPPSQRPQPRPVLGPASPLMPFIPARTASDTREQPAPAAPAPADTVETVIIVIPAPQPPQPAPVQADSIMPSWFD